MQYSIFLLSLFFLCMVTHVSLSTITVTYISSMPVHRHQATCPLLAPADCHPCLLHHHTCADASAPSLACVVAYVVAYALCSIFYLHSRMCHCLHAVTPTFSHLHALLALINNPIYCSCLADVLFFYPTATHWQPVFCWATEYLAYSCHLISVIFYCFVLSWLL